ncbi:hypothetical protein [Desertibaculum subflavum]|uniref:hypothetical protein n=1 Tax=Desertibaculum subflavum TaxID=2268458 RepID=UPI000E67525D
MLQKAVPNRRIHYEVAALREGRWLIECTREAEAEAIDVARMFLKLDSMGLLRIAAAYKTIWNGDWIAHQVSDTFPWCETLRQQIRDRNVRSRQCRAPKR